MNQKLKFFIVGAFVALAAFLDIITALISDWRFEANPLYIATGSIGSVIFVKMVVIGLFLALFYYSKNIKLKNIYYFALVLASVFLVVVQVLAAQSNMEVKKALEIDPSIKPPSDEVKAGAYKNFMWRNFYLPLLFSLVSFGLYEWLYRSKTI